RKFDHDFYTRQTLISLEEMIKNTYPRDDLSGRFFYTRDESNITKIESPYKYREEIQYGTTDKIRKEPRQSIQVYLTDPLHYVEQYEKHYPFQALYQMTQALFFALAQQMQNTFLRSIKNEMEKKPKYWIPLQGTTSYPIKKLVQPNSIKDYQKLAKDLSDKSTSAKLEARQLLEKDYGNLTSRRNTQREIDVDRAKTLIKYAYLFQRLGEMAKTRAIDPIVSVLRNQGAIDLFFRYITPPLTMNAYALERFITQIKDVQGRYKEYLEYKAKSEDYSYRRRAEESKFHKYKTAEI